MISRSYLQSSSFKMALLFTVLLTLSAAILGYFLMSLGKRDFLRETEAAIDMEISMLVSLAGLGSLQTGLLPYIERRSADDPRVRFRYEDASGTLLGGSIDPVPVDASPITEGVVGFDLQTPAGRQSFAAKIHTLDDGSRIVAARNVHELMASYDQLKRLSVLIMALMLTVVLVSFAISYFVVSRINRIAATAGSIVETGDLSQRLTIDSRWDDLSNLSLVLNGFLERIEDLMNSAREVSNNIAHDLRTPLSGLRSDIEALKTHARDGQQEAQIDAVLADVDHILAIFHALLRISNIEKGARSQQLAALDLSRIVSDVAELYEPVAEERNIRLEVALSEHSGIRGDANLLFQLFANILDNAIKFSPVGGRIVLSVSRNADQIVAAVQDQGPGIPDEEKGSVFKHFYRGDASRSTPGNGLGLSLVSAVAEHHQARIRLNNLHPGLSVSISFRPYQ